MGRAFLLYSMMLIAPNAQADGLACLTHFANAADAADTERLIRETYAKLFAGLGTQVTPETVKKMVTKQDPFTVPEKGGVDAGALNRALKEFSRMVKEMGRNTPEVRQMLLADLAGRGEDLAEAKATLDVATDETVKDHTLSFGKPVTLAASPTPERWVVAATTNDPSDRKLKLFVGGTDGKSSPHAGTLIATSPPAFSADGKALYTTDMKGRLAVIPFADGKPKLKAVRYIGEESFATAMRTPRFGKSPDRVVSSNEDGYSLTLYDLRKKTAVPIKLPATMRDHEVKDWGFIPGTDDFWAFSDLSGIYQMTRMTLAADGSTTVIGSPDQWLDSFLRNHKVRVVSLPDRSGFLLYANQKVTVLKNGAGDPVSIYPKLALALPANVDGVTMVPRSPFAAAVIHLADKKRVDLIDADKAQVVDSFELPHTEWVPSGIEVSVDGRILYLRENDTTWRAINLKERVKPETAARFR